MHRTTLTALASGLLAVSLAACSSGGGNDAASVRTKVAAQLAESGMDDKAATCFARILVDEIGAKELGKISFSADAPPKGMEDEFAAAAIKASDTCRIDVSQLNG